MHEDVFPGTLDNRKNFFEAHMIKVELRRHPGIQGTYLWSQRCQQGYRENYGQLCTILSLQMI